MSSILLFCYRIIPIIAAIIFVVVIPSSIPTNAIFYDPISDNQTSNDYSLPEWVIRDSRYKPHVEFWSTPVHFTEGQPFTIYAMVSDEFGEIQEATLEYSYINGPSQLIKMELTDGTYSNGTYVGTIPEQQLGALDIRLFFKDNLGHRNAISFREMVHKDTDGPSIACELSSRETLSWEPIAVKCNTKDDWSGVEKVSLFGTGGEASFQSLSDMILTSAQGEIDDDSQSGYTHYWAISKIFESGNSYTPGIAGNQGKFKAIAYDYAGNKRETEDFLSYIVKNEEESLSMNVTIVDLDISAKTLRADLQANGKINNVKYVDGKLQDVFSPVIEATYVPNYAKEDLANGHSNSLPFVNVPVNQATPTVAVVPIEGEPWLFPFDSYSIDLIFSNTVPSSRINITNPTIRLDESLQSQWKIVKPSDTYYASSSVGIPAIAHIEFERNPYVAAGLYLPLFGVFFLLGAVLILENNTDQLTNKLAISIGVFAFIFAFTQIDALKPSTSGAPTISDMLIFSAAIATITYGVSSAVSVSLLETRYESLPIDLIIFVGVSLFISLLFISQTNYPPEIVAVMLLIVVAGLGYGIAVRFLLRHKVKHGVKHYPI